MLQGVAELGDGERLFTTQGAAFTGCGAGKPSCRPKRTVKQLKAGDDRDSLAVRLHRGGLDRLLSEGGRMSVGFSGAHPG